MLLEVNCEASAILGLYWSCQLSLCWKDLTRKGTIGLINSKVEVFKDTWDQMSFVLIWFALTHQWYALKQPLQLLWPYLDHLSSIQASNLTQEQHLVTLSSYNCRRSLCTTQNQSWDSCGRCFQVLLQSPPVSWSSPCSWRTCQAWWDPQCGRKGGLGYLCERQCFALGASTQLLHCVSRVECHWTSSIALPFLWDVLLWSYQGLEYNSHWSNLFSEGRHFGFLNVATLESNQKPGTSSSLF